MEREAETLIGRELSGSMGHHTVFLEARHLEMPNISDKGAIAFTVRDDGKIIGTFHVGRGSVKWVGAKRSFEKVKEMPWPKFLRVMEENE